MIESRKGCLPYLRQPFHEYNSYSLRNMHTRGPLVAHLKMTVYKGIGEHSSSQSPTMNFDRSIVSLRLNMGYVDNINRM